MSGILKAPIKAVKKVFRGIKKIAKPLAIAAGIGFIGMTAFGAFGMGPFASFMASKGLAFGGATQGALSGLPGAGMVGGLGGAKVAAAQGALASGAAAPLAVGGSIAGGAAGGILGSSATAAAGMQAFQSGNFASSTAANLGSPTAAEGGIGSSLKGTYVPEPGTLRGPTLDRAITQPMGDAAGEFTPGVLQTSERVAEEVIKNESSTGGWLDGLKDMFKSDDAKFLAFMAAAPTGAAVIKSVYERNMLREQMEEEERRQMERQFWGVERQHAGAVQREKLLKAGKRARPTTALPGPQQVPVGQTSQMFAHDTSRPLMEAPGNPFAPTAAQVYIPFHREQAYGPEYEGGVNLRRE